MSLTPWKPLWEKRLPSLREEMDRIFEELFQEAGFSSLREREWLPPVDIRETKKDVIITMDIPAMDPKKFTVAVSSNRVIVTGERQRADEGKGREYYRVERVHGAIQRTVYLPADVSEEKTRATYKDGVLKITAPKSQRAQPKEIKVKYT